MKTRNILKILIAFLFLLFTAFSMKIIIDLGIVPLKYIIGLIVILLILNLIADFILMKKCRLIFKLGGLLIYLVLEIIFFLIIFYGNATNKFLDKSFDNAAETYQVPFYLISKTDYKKEDIKKRDIFYHTDIMYKDNILNKLFDEDITRFVEIDDMKELLTKDIILIEKSTFSVLGESMKGFKSSDYKIIYEINLEFDLSNEAIGEEEFDEEQLIKYQKLTPGEYYNIFIGGYDFTNVYMDFNMLVSINKTNNEILITSVPRDFYITDPRVNKMDKLSAMGSRGIESNISAVAKMFGVKIDYYIQINAASLVEIVDAVGGITYCSDKEFTTTHAMILNSYNNWLGETLHVNKGCYSYDGIETLTIARERMAFPTGDMQRQKNCAQIVMAILNKMKSPSIASNYTNVLNAVSGFYTTTIPKDLVTSSVKDLLENGKWKIKSQSVVGNHGEGYIYTEHLTGYVLKPDPSSVRNAKYKIQGLKYHKLSEL